MEERNSLLRPSEQLRAFFPGRLWSLVDFERLAGVDTECNAERVVLWRLFQHLYGGSRQEVAEALADHCATIALARVADGRLSLIARKEQA